MNRPCLAGLIGSVVTLGVLAGGRPLPAQATSSASSAGPEARNANDSIPRTASADLTCGPRCVRVILRHFGREDDDLIELIREIQWPNLESGASLSSIQKALEARGVHTRALRIGQGTTLRWRHPVLLHMAGGEGGGHYIVWVPSGPRGESTVWAGVEGWKRGSWEAVTRGRSGVILLTSPVPITDPDEALEESRWDLRSAGWTLLIAVGLLVINQMLISRGLPGRARASSRMSDPLRGDDAMGTLGHTP